MISAGKQTSKNDSTFAALKARLAQGRGKMVDAAAKSRKAKTSWSKAKAKSAGNPGATFAVGGATPGVKPPGNKA